MKKRVYIIAMVALLMISAIFLLYFRWNKPHENIETIKGIQINATDLFNEFAQYEKQATQTYNSKVLEISGIVSSIATNQEGKAIVQLQTDDPMFGINCTMEKDPGIKQGEAVTIKGVCSGFTTDVILIRCYLIKKTI